MACPPTWSTTAPLATGCVNWSAAGFRLLDLIEPAWPEDLDATWGQWSRLRGEIFPGTAIFVTELTVG